MVATACAGDNDVSCSVWLAHATRKEFPRVETAVFFMLVTLDEMEAGLQCERLGGQDGRVGDVRAEASTGVARERPGATALAG